MTQTRRKTNNNATRSRAKGRAATSRRTHAASRPQRAAASKTAATRTLTARRTSTARRGNTRANPNVGQNAFLVLLTIVTGLSLLGLTMVLSASSVTSLTSTGSPWGEFISQATWLGLGAFAMVAATLIDYRLLRRFTVPILIVSLVMLVAVLFPQFGVSVNGAQRWIRLGPVQFQPSEIAKLSLVLFAADNLARSKKVEVNRQLKPIVVVLVAFSGLILLQPNLGTTIILFVIGLAALFASGVRVVYIAGLGLLSATAASALAYFAPYRRDRLLAFQDPWQDPLGDGWQTIQSLVSVANGGITGVGIGESRGKYGFLPEAHNDFVFAVTAEEFGLVGASIVVLGYVVFGITGLVVARRADRFGALLVVGVTSWILVQAFINIGAVLGVLPITGVPLPFMSAGGTSLVTTLVGVGLVFNVARSTR